MGKAGEKNVKNKEEKKEENRTLSLWSMEDGDRNPRWGRGGVNDEARATATGWL